MKNPFALMGLLLVSLICLVSCDAGGNFGEIFPAEATRKAARDLDLKSVKEIHLNVSPDGPIQSIIVTDPQTITLLVEGLKTAITTDITNQVDSVEVIGKSGEVLMGHNFSSATPSHTVSPQFIEGLKAAGVKSRSWTANEEAAQSQQEMIERLPLFLPFIGLMALLTFFFFKRKTRADR